MKGKRNENICNFFGINRRRGFTIIELIVVIAIIAVLAAIVLTNVASYNLKSKDAAARADLATLITAGIKYYESHGNYTGFITGSSDYAMVANALTSANMGYGPIVGGTNTGAANYNYDNAPYTKWCFAVTLKANANRYCVDSKGTKIQSANSTCCSWGCCSSQNGDCSACTSSS